MSAYPNTPLHKRREPEKREAEPKHQVLDDSDSESEGEEEESRHRLPAIPDLRFEYSYLRSIRPYLHLRVRDGGSEEREPRYEVEKVEWGMVLWTTFASQVLSPLLQGALWGVAGHYLTPLVRDALSRKRHASEPGLEPAPTEGKISAWLRGIVQKLRLRPQTTESS